MNLQDENMPIGENEDELTEGSHQAINGSKDTPDEKKNASNKLDSTKTITDLQDERGEANSAEDDARQQGPYGVEE